MSCIPYPSLDDLSQVLLVLRREGKTISKFFLEQAEHYVILHEPGNPQQLLSHFLEDNPPHVAPKICGFGSRNNPCNKPAIAIAIHESGYKMLVCEKHMKELESEPKWRVKQIDGKCSGCYRRR